jgi:hypothetical protein
MARVLVLETVMEYEADIVHTCHLPTLTLDTIMLLFETERLLLLLVTE